MVNVLKEMGQGRAWRLMVAAALRGAEEHRLELKRKPGRGLSNVWELVEGGKIVSVSIRTTRDRYIAFPPLENGTRWKTLDDVQKVLVATVDDPETPTKIEVYLFEAADVRARFDASYAARTAAGHVITDDFGMWLSLDRDVRDTPISVGTGIVQAYKPIAHFTIADLIERSGEGQQPPRSGAEGSVAAQGHDSVPESVGEIIAWARERIARAASVPVEVVKLDLRIEYH